MVQLYVAVDILKDPPQVMTPPMTLIETEVAIQKMIADPMNGVTAFPDDEGVYHGDYMGDTVALKPVPHDPEEVEQ